MLTVLAAGCGSSPAPVTRSPTTTPPPATTTAPATASATAAPSVTTTSGNAQHATVTPATGLRTGQKVQVQASGFSPGESLVVTECASKGTATGSGDCDLTGIQSVTADAGGRVKVELTVSKGPFGANKIVCGPAQACLVSVTQATPSPTEEADAPIAFALSPCRSPSVSRPGRIWPRTGCRWPESADGDGRLPGRLGRIRQAMEEEGAALRIVRKVARQAGITKKLGPHTLRHAFITAAQMGRIASDASFGRSGEHALPAAQRAALRPAWRAGAAGGAVTCDVSGWLHQTPGCAI